MTAHRMQFVLATANPDKAAEIRAVLLDAGLDVELVPRPADVPEVDETGTTLEENARLKAVALCQATGLPAVADDTGLAVDALGGAPGVYSARYAGTHGDDEANNRRLLAEMADVPDERRGAAFVCALALADPEGEIRAEVQAA